MATQNSFRDWLVREVRDALGQPSNPPPFLVWCDPDHSWRDLLNEGARAGGFELWAPEPGQEAMHELLVRDRFYRAKRVHASSGFPAPATRLRGSSRSSWKRPMSRK